MFYPLFAAPTGFAATLIVAALIAGRCGLWRQSVASAASPMKPQLQV
jgi:hypothetical protein